MHVWLVQVGEPLPTDPGAPRLYRSGLMAREFHARGHTLDWFAADFNHFTKQSRGLAGKVLEPEAHYRIHLLASPGYANNVSLARLRDHAALVHSFRAAIQILPAPDVILCSYPTIELAHEVVLFGRSRGIPVVLDVRDLWPASFLDSFPRAARLFVRPLLYTYYRQARRCFREADRVIGNTDAMVRWARDLAGVPLRPGDGGVYLAYPDTPPPDGLADAEAMWDASGVKRSQGFRIACFFGTFNPKYLDLETVIRACADEDVRRAGIACVLCGDGDGHAACRALAADAPNVILPGWVNAPAIHTLLRRSDVGLAPYRNCLNFCASIPNKPPEYFSASLPILSSLDGELRILVEREGCGMQYPSGDPRALATALLTLQSDPLAWEARSRRAGALYERAFRAEVVYGRFVEDLEAWVASRA